MKNVWIISLGVLTLLSLTSGFIYRTEEHIQKREHMLKHVDEFARNFVDEYTNCSLTGIQTERLDSMFKMMKLPPTVGRLEFGELPPEDAIMSCIFCRSTFALLLQQYRSGTRTQEQLMQETTEICQQVTTYGPVVCEGLINLNAAIVFHIIDARPSLTANQMCSFVLPEECGDPPAEFNFNINVSPGPPITESKSGSVPRNPNEWRVLHFSDPHYDPNYLVGGFAACPEPVCCRRERGMATNPADRAGRWGDYRDCDSSFEIVEDAFRAARRNHPQVDFVYVTGDYVDHGVWETTHDGNLAIMDRFYNMVAQVFAGVQVYPVFGNHEAQPTNVFAPPHIQGPLSVQWLYDYSASVWSRWLPAHTQATIRRGGYYTVLHSPGFRIIALNNNNCYIYDWWVMYSRDETAHQLQWLHDTLLAAEAAGERVHLVYHIPSGGGSCFRWWSQQFRRVIERFHRIIQGQFNGHSHRDDFNVFYAQANINHAISYSWNGGSTTTFGGVNPNYALYYIDRTLYQVQEKESWIYSITEANQNEATPPRWYRHYALRDHFGIPDLSPASLDHFITTRLATSRSMLWDLFRFRVKDSDYFVQPGCDDECLRNSVCRLVINEFNDLRKCNQLRALPLV